MRLVFMGTPAFALPTLKALHEAGHEIAAVYTQPPRPSGRGQKETPSLVHQYAEDHQLPVHTPVSLKSPEVQAEFVNHKAEAAVVVAYGLLLPEPILKAYPFGCINVHPSLLPRWRGAAPIQRSIMAGDTKTAICIMQMNEGLDTGDILLQKNYTIPDFFDAGSLHDMLSQEAGALVLETLSGLKEGNISPEKQSENGVTYANKISKDECRIDWNKTAQEIHNQVRGLSPHPGAYSHFNNEVIKIFDTEIASHAESNELTWPGTVLTHQLDVKCGKGMLSLMELQRPGKKRIGREEFLMGYPIPPGSIFE